MNKDRCMFRAYDKKEKVMLHSVGVFGDYIILEVVAWQREYFATSLGFKTGQDLLKEFHISDLELWNSFLIKIAIGDRFDVMQCLGRKDRNGKLIYEGDRLQKIDKDFFDKDNSSEMRELQHLRDTNMVVYEEEWGEEMPNILMVAHRGRIDVATMDRFPRFWLKEESFGYKGEGLEDCECWERIGTIYETMEN